MLPRSGRLVTPTVLAAILICRPKKHIEYSLCNIAHALCSRDALTHEVLHPLENILIIRHLHCCTTIMSVDLEYRVCTPHTWKIDIVPIMASPRTKAR